MLYWRGMPLHKAKKGAYQILHILTVKKDATSHKGNDKRGVIVSLFIVIVIQSS